MISGRIVICNLSGEINIQKELRIIIYIICSIIRDTTAKTSIPYRCGSVNTSKCLA